MDNVEFAIKDCKPLGSRVLMLWEETNMEYKVGGITLARADTSHTERHYTGIVQAIGPTVAEVKVGERVFFDQFCGPVDLHKDGFRYALVNESDILAIIPPRGESMTETVDKILADVDTGQPVGTAEVYHGAD